MDDRKPSGAEIAVIGVAGRFPGAKSVDELWRNLLAGTESITTFTDDELRRAGVSDEELADPSYVKASAVIDDIGLFDAEFFRISPREARFLDPQQRMFLECAWEALESAGYGADRAALRAGVFAGASVSTYLLRNLATHPSTLGADKVPTMFGNAGDFMPSRVSYKLDLTGPSVNVQTACSTSLAAIHLACQNLLSGESDLALAGGATIQVPHVAGYVHHRESILSPDGHCRPFDAAARGTVNGSGVAVVVLKRLADALRDRDNVLAVVLGGSINNDGAGKMGYTAPSVAGQREVISDALAVAGVSPSAIGYVETHGTGTTLGDPIEIAALAEVFADATRGKTCALGALKSNIGHLDIVAGIASFIKAVHVLREGKIPPTVHFRAPNPALGLERTPFVIRGEALDWIGPAEPRRAGVSAFGIGGTNVHVVLEEPPALPSSPRSGPEILLLSAKTRPALDDALVRLRDHLARERARGSDLVLADVAHTLRVGREAFEERCAVAVDGIDDAIEALSSGGERIKRGRDQHGASRVVFVFPGQGSQLTWMGRDLYARDAAFRDDLDRVARAIEAASGHRILAAMYPASEDAADRLSDPELVQLTTFAIEHALATHLARWNVRPAAVIGHSLGEYAAACAAGVLSLGDAVRAVAIRAKAMASTPAGGMLVVALEEPEARRIGTELSLDFAAENAPGLSVLSGAEDAIARAEVALASRGIDARRLRVQRANHSRTMDAIVGPLRAELSPLAFAAPAVPFYSTVTGRLADADTLGRATYWAEQVRKPVRFSSALRAVLEGGDAIFLEVGPGRALTSLVKRHGATAVPMLPGREGVEEAHAAFGALAALWAHGAAVDLGVFDDGARRRVPLPTYPFQRKLHWVEPRANVGSGTSVVSEAGPSTSPVIESVSVRVESESDAATVIASVWKEVLGVEHVGLDDDFFALGGDSLLATQVTARLRQRLGLDPSVRDLFDAPTPSRLAARLAVGGTTLAARAPIVGRAEGEPTPLSLAQERLYFLDRVSPGDPAHNITGALRLRGVLDRAALHEAIDGVGRRHEALRTVFVASEDGVARAVVRVELPPTYRVAQSAEGADLDTLARSEASAPFDLATGPLWRALLVELGVEDHVLVVTMHHIVSDGWSVGIVAREIASLYDAARRGVASPLAPLPIQYGDFAAWQRARFDSGTLGPHLEHFVDVLRDVPLVLDLPTDRPRGRVVGSVGGHVVRRLDRASSDAVLRVARALGATPFMVLLGAFELFLARVSGQEDFVVGTPVAGRGGVELEALIGMFVSTLALRSDVPKAKTFAELVARVRAQTLAAQAHQELPFDRLVDALPVERDPSRTPVFQTMFALQGAPTASLDVGDLGIEPLDLESGISPYELAVDVVPLPEGYRLSWEYDATLFDEATIANLASCFEVLLASALRDVSTPLAELAWLDDAERERVLGVSSRVGRASDVADAPLSLEDLVAASATAHPTAIAVEHEGVALTYRELALRVRALAAQLVLRGAGADTVVGVRMRRSIDAIVAIVAILEAGAAYVPIDVTTPAERARAILEDSGARLLFDDGTAAPVVGSWEVVSASASMASSETSARKSSRDPSSAAYVIYTSGSTGRPKGVVVASRSVARYVVDFARAMQIGAGDRVLQLATLAFDTSVEEIFGALSSGATLVLRSEQMLDGSDRFLAEVTRAKISVLDLPTGLWIELTDSLGVSSTFPESVRLVILGGERAPRVTFDAWRTRVGARVRLVNTYGPTEATIVATMADLADPPPGELPIGAPVASALAYVLDRHGHPQPRHVPGELYLGGECVARGYLGAPAATAERFVPNPFGEGRLYRTGDRVRRAADGTLVFLGRTDAQIKIRGFRVELGEIEAALEGCAGVREAVVLTTGEGNARQLVAYVVGAEAPALRSELSDRLPSYMIPSLVIVDALPRTPSGKVDRRALGALGTTTSRTSRVAPRTPHEAAMADLWREVLGVADVGVEDDFFELGGNSLLVLRLASLARTRLGLEVPVGDVMAKRTIAAISGASGADPGASSPLVAFGPDPEPAAPAIVFVHALSGEVFPYRELAARLEGRACFGLRSPLIDAPGDAASLAELAAVHADAIAELDRPIHLVGWSLGGVIAHEIAHQLETLGRAVRTLALLDSFLHSPEDEAPPFLVALHALLAGRAPSRLAATAEDAEAIVAEALACDRETAARLLRIHTLHLALAAAHTPSRVRAPTLLVAAGEGPAGEGAPLADWQPVADLQRIVVPSDHHTMLGADHVSALALALEAHFVSAD